MSSFSQVDYARSGFVATDTVRLEAGELEQIVEVTMVEQLKKLGLPVMVRNARVMLMEDYTICGSGDVLTPEQAKLLVCKNKIKKSIFWQEKQIPKIAISFFPCASIDLSNCFMCIIIKLNQ